MVLLKEFLEIFKQLNKVNITLILMGLVGLGYILELIGNHLI